MENWKNTILIEKAHSRETCKYTLIYTEIILMKSLTLYTWLKILRHKSINFFFNLMWYVIRKSLNLSNKLELSLIYTICQQGKSISTMNHENNHSNVWTPSVKLCTLLYINVWTPWLGPRPWWGPVTTCISQYLNVSTPCWGQIQWWGPVTTCISQYLNVSTPCWGHIPWWGPFTTCISQYLNVWTPFWSHTPWWALVTSKLIIICLFYLFCNWFLHIWAFVSIQTKLFQHMIFFPFQFPPLLWL